MRKLVFILVMLAVASFVPLGPAAAQKVEIYPWWKPRAQVDPTYAGTRPFERGRQLRPQDRDERTRCVYANFWEICAEKRPISMNDGSSEQAGDGVNVAGQAIEFRDDEASAGLAAVLDRPNEAGRSSSLPDFGSEPTSSSCSLPRSGPATSS